MSSFIWSVHSRILHTLILSDNYFIDVDMGVAVLPEGIPCCLGRDSNLRPLSLEIDTITLRDLTFIFNLWRGCLQIFDPTEGVCEKILIF